MFIKNMAVSAKLWLLIFLSALTVIFMASVSLFDLRQSVQQEREIQLRSLLDTSLSLISSLHAKVDAGDFSDSEAQHQARILLADLRYDKNEYFFVLNSNADVLVHGADSTQVGRNLEAVKSPDGQFVFSHMASLLNSDTKIQKFNYFWPKAGSVEPQPKLSFATTYEPWGWVIGTGVYTDDLNTAFFSQAIKMCLQLLVVASRMII